MSIIRDATHSKITELAKLRNASTPLHRYLREADSEGIRFLVYEQDNEIRGFAMLFLHQPAEGSPKSHIPKLYGNVINRAVVSVAGRITVRRSDESNTARLGERAVGVFFFKDKFK